MAKMCAFLRTDFHQAQMLYPIIIAKIADPHLDSNTQMLWALPRSMLHPFTKFHGNWYVRFSGILPKVRPTKTLKASYRQISVHPKTLNRHRFILNILSALTCPLETSIQKSIMLLCTVIIYIVNSAEFN